MWSLIFERIFYFSNDLKADLDKVISQWEKPTAVLGMLEVLDKLISSLFLN